MRHVDAGHVDAGCRATHLSMLTAVTITTLLWCGCRSVPGLNRFVRSSEPSADVLAGTGPSATYPAPPSVSATPQAIASIAGGTKAPSAGSVPSIGGPSNSVPSMGPNPSPKTAQVAGVDVSPGYATPATNYAAANANGVYSKPRSNVSGAAKPSPYTFGSKTFTPKTAPETSPVLPVTNHGSTGDSVYAKSSFGLPATTAGMGNPAPAGTGPVAGGNYTAPPSVTSPTSPGSTSIASGKKSGSGFTLPTNVPVTNAPATNMAATNMAATNVGPTNLPATATASITPPAAAPSKSAGSATPFGMPSSDNAAAPAAVYSTANSSGSLTTSPTPTKQGSYMPGSTGKSSIYPANSQETPATSGTFFR
ncbi:hypothetical protein [Rubripirellula obstinata]|uniref:hypothetical protein n=1 Tax=Rubripirellula obstinata TaxID=406547 RepID=UPI00122C3FE7|nr:hypothetical protein [Rubripirellula obstinata]